MSDTDRPLLPAVEALLPEELQGKGYRFAPPMPMERHTRWGVWALALGRLLLFTLVPTLLLLWLPVTAWVGLPAALAFCAATSAVALGAIRNRWQARSLGPDIWASVPAPPIEVASRLLAGATAMVAGAFPLAAASFVESPWTVRVTLLLFGAGFLLLALAQLLWPEVGFTDRGILFRGRLVPWAEGERVESVPGAILVHLASGPPLRIPTCAIDEACAVARLIEDRMGRSEGRGVRDES